MNSVVLVGRLTKDPEKRYIPGSGTAVVNFTIAIDRDYTKKDGSKETDFIPVEVMGKAAEFVANYITKGRLVGVQGSIRVDRYETQSGEKRTFTKVSAKSIQALDSKKGNADNAQSNNQDTKQPPNQFQAIDDDEIPF